MRASLCAAFIQSLRKNINFLAVFLIISSSAFASGRQALPERYKNWLQQDVAYIITNEEKKSFLDLPTDAERAGFIEHFWEIRNPTPPHRCEAERVWRERGIVRPASGRLLHVEIALGDARAAIDVCKT